MAMTMVSFILCLQYNMDTGVLTIMGNGTAETYGLLLSNLTYFNKYAITNTRPLMFTHALNLFMHSVILQHD